MYCRKCGEQIDDEAAYCIHCGCATKDVTQVTIVNPDHDQPKTLMGVMMSLFLGILGLIIGVLMYPEGTVARKTFVKAWVTTLVVTVVIYVALFVMLIMAEPTVIYE